MLLSLVVHTYSLRYWLPATIMLGTAPAYLLSWGAWRLFSTVLPARLYHKLDDRLYCIYQSTVLFFFENYTGVEVSDLSSLQYLYACFLHIYKITNIDHVPPLCFSGLFMNVMFNFIILIF